MSIKQSSITPATPPTTREHLPDCWHRERDRQCLRIEVNSGEAFLFPYAQFLGAHHIRSANAEILKISFSTHQVSLSGKNLSEIALALEDLAVGWIKPVPGRYIKVAEAEGAFVTDIEVKAADNSV